MKILVIGATGFIGKSIYEELKKLGYEVIAGVRNPNTFDEKFIQIDFTSLDKDVTLAQKIHGFDIVINAVGIIAPQKGQTFEQMHALAPMALFDVAKKAKVKRIIQISALRA